MQDLGLGVGDAATGRSRIIPLIHWVPRKIKAFAQ